VAPLTSDRRIAIQATADAELARAQARILAQHLGFDAVATEAITLATMELASNLLRYATNGAILLSPVQRGAATGLEIESCDEGPGIADIAHALTDNFSTGGGLGCGLPAVRRLMDTFSLTTQPGGTRIVAQKWRH
jgi:serine/threonine-protein kinase RsbT